MYVENNIFAIDGINNAITGTKKEATVTRLGNVPQLDVNEDLAIFTFWINATWLVIHPNCWETTCWTRLIPCTSVHQYIRIHGKLSIRTLVQGVDLAGGRTWLLP